MMRRQLTLAQAERALRIASRAKPSHMCSQCRTIQISAAPATPSSDVTAPVDNPRDPADARFEVLGSPQSLLSVSLSASQNLYTRRGTLVSVAGKVENVQSTLSPLSPLVRGFLGIPFLYQRISSTTPITALIATKSPSTTFTILHLDGTTDWQIGQRNALLAWTGHTLTPSPSIQRGLSLAHWGNTHLTGRGLAALSSPGQIYQLTLAKDEEIVLHPSHVVAYSISRDPPLPFRLKSTSLRLQIPSMPSFLTNALGNAVPSRMSRFLEVVRDSTTYKGFGRFLFRLRTALRRSVWGDRLFLQFKGPTTILMSSRGVRVNDVLSNDQVNEIADTEAGQVARTVKLAIEPPRGLQHEKRTEQKPVAVHVAKVGQDGKVSFEDSKDLKDFVR